MRVNLIYHHGYKTRATNMIHMHKFLGSGRFHSKAEEATAYKMEDIKGFGVHPDYLWIPAKGWKLLEYEGK